MRSLKRLSNQIDANCLEMTQQRLAISQLCETHKQQCGTKKLLITMGLSALLGAAIERLHSPHSKMGGISRRYIGMNINNMVYSLSMLSGMGAAFFASQLNRFALSV
ncbi:hypothetical protein QX776_17855 [Alteromonadaceae bacterium BrNp21-10]|nr:hypothetical protein [Alteromonadaceae bacterium BrNp21-10]